MSDIQSLKDFLTLCRLKSFTKAAEHCHVTTSGLSRRIQNLEVWLSAPVVDRSRSHFELTAAGKLLLDAAQDAIGQLEAVRNAVRKQTDEQANQIRLAAPHVMSSTFFPGWLGRLHTQFGQAKFAVTSAVVSECMSMMERAEVDFVITFDDEAQAIRDALKRSDAPTSDETIELGFETLIPVSSLNMRGEPLHALRRGGKAVSFLGYSEECSLGWALAGALNNRNDLPVFGREHENSLADGLRSMALVGMGLAWLPESMVREDLATRRLVRAAPASFDVPLRVVMARKAIRLGSRAEQLWEQLSTERSVGARELKRA